MITNETFETLRTQHGQRVDILRRWEVTPQSIIDLLKAPPEEAFFFDLATSVDAEQTPSVAENPEQARLMMSSFERGFLKGIAEGLLMAERAGIRPPEKLPNV